jgi:GNAT superfamily N-acetyltransferase
MKSNSIPVRPMTEGDAEGVAALSTQLGYPSTTDQTLRRFRAIGDAPDARVWVAELPDGAIVGWIHLFGNRLLESDPDIEIGGLVVHEAVRGRGVGRALVQAAEAWARERGYTVVSVRSNVIRREAHEFYKGLGYEPTKSQFKFRKKLPPADGSSRSTGS